MASDKSKKAGRNLNTCKRYKTEGRQEVNGFRRFLHHLKAQGYWDYVTQSLAKGAPGDVQNAWRGFMARLSNTQIKSTIRLIPSLKDVTQPS